MSTQDNTVFSVEQFLKDNKQELTCENLEEIIRQLQSIRNEIKGNEREKIKLKQINKKRQDNLNGKVLYIKPRTRRIAAYEYSFNKDIVKVVCNSELCEIGEFAFAGCTNLTEIVFPNNLVSLRKGCFKNCVSLKSLSLPDISNIYPCAFEGCYSLEKVFIPSSVTNVYSNAFKDCSSLSSVVFEEKGRFSFNPTHVFKGAFENCTSLSEITLYNASIDRTAFVNCKNLKEITLYNRWKYNIEFEKCDATIVWI